MVEKIPPNPHFTEQEWKWGIKWMISQLDKDPAFITDYTYLADSMVAALIRRREILGIDEGELKDFHREIMPYMRRYWEYVSRYKGKDPNSPDHPAHMKVIGQHYRAIRHFCGLSREDTALWVGVDSVVLSAFEGGIVPPRELPPSFIRNLTLVVLHDLKQKVFQEEQKLPE